MARRRLVAGVAVVGITLAACGSDDDATDNGATTTEFTLLPTTTTTLPPETAPPTTDAAIEIVATTTAPTTTAPAAQTTTTTEVASTTTTIPPNPAAEALVLTTIGIGSAEFGADPEGVISFVSSFLGPTTFDTGWVEPFTIAPCSGTELRLVSWGVLTLQFGDVSTVVQGRRHFFAYSYGTDGQIGGEPVGLVTDRGLTVGSRVIDLLAAYPGVQLFPEDDFIPPNFYVNDNLRGYLTGLLDEDTVTVIFGGIGCWE